jgi:hypothetical protein
MCLLWSKPLYFLSARSVIAQQAHCMHQSEASWQRLKSNRDDETPDVIAMASALNSGQNRSLIDAPDIWILMMFSKDF